MPSVNRLLVPLATPNQPRLRIDHFLSNHFPVRDIKGIQAEGLVGSKLNPVFGATWLKLIPRRGIPEHA